MNRKYAIPQDRHGEEYVVHYAVVYIGRCGVELTINFAFYVRTLYLALGTNPFIWSEYLSLSIYLNS